MFFLLRTAFWLCVVLALLPTGGAQQPATKEVSFGAIEAVSAAGAAVADLGQFCDRQPEACEVGAHAAAAFGERAQAGAKMVYEFLSERMAPAETGSVSPAKNAGAVGAKGSQQTLKPSDLQPAWRGPAPRKESQPRDSRHPA